MKSLENRLGYRTSWNDSQDEGITGLHYAYRLIHEADRFSDTYFPPSQFAIGWIAAHSEQELRTTLDALIKNQDKLKDVPELVRMIEEAKAYQHEHPKKSLSGIVIDLLSGLAKNIYGTDKIIRRNMIQEVNLLGDESTMSPYEQLSIRVDTREKRSKKDKATFLVSLYHPVVRDEKPPMFYAEGGTLHEKKRKGQLNHWTTDDRHFIEDLKKSLASDFAKDKIQIQGDIVEEEFTKPTLVIGYAYASALIKFASQVKEKKIRLKPGEQPLLPFDFDRHPKYAFEAFIMAHTFKRQKNQSSLVKRLFSTDMYLSGKNIATKQFVDWHRQGTVTKEAVKYSRSFGDYNWAIIQALEKHFYLKDRPDKRRRYFVGYGLEFRNTPYMTISLVFRNRPEQGSSIDSVMKDFDVRIIYDSNLKLPYVMYKAPLMNAEKILTPGLRTHPLSKVNYAKGVSRGMHEEDHGLRLMI